jgi:hypothetical protein
MMCGVGAGWASTPSKVAVGLRAAAAESASNSRAPALTAAQQQEFASARRAATEILARDEFQPPPVTWWDRVKMKLEEWLGRLFLGVNRVTTRSPWVGKLLEWLLFMGAAAGLLVWLLRTVRRQRLRVAVGEAAQATTAWARETEEWQRQAQQEAARGAWREAIHALYWAAIVHLERQRAWRHNPARTPREYVRLLKPGSGEQKELRGLTAALERTWYGQREARAEEYGAAQESFLRLAGGERFAGGERAAEFAGGRS